MYFKKFAMLCVFATTLALSSLSARADVLSQAVKDNKGYHAAARILVKANSGLSEDRFLNILAKHSAKFDHKIQKINVSIVKVPRGLEKKIIDSLSKEAGIEYAELDRIIPPSLTPNDPYFGNQWHHQKIGSPAAWDTPNQEGVIIAILDTGVDSNHPDLKGVMLPGWNIVNGNTDSSDVRGHGTAVAGTAAAIFNNAAGVSGLARGAKILPIRITNDPGGYAYFSDVARAITWAADNGAKVVNNSYGSYVSSSVISAAGYLKSKGGMTFISAMNNSADCTVPADPNTMVVSATDSNDLKASFSNYGACVDVSAPGVGIYTTSMPSGYGGWYGTSFSAPLAAGLAAFLFSVNHQLGPHDVENIMKVTAHDPEGTDFSVNFGYGRINAAAATAMAVNYVATDGQAPTASITTPKSGTTISGIVDVAVNATDNVGVAKVELFINGSYFGTDTIAPHTFSWDTTLLGNASATLTAYAYDAAGNKSPASNVSVQVRNIVDSTPPVVSISRPAPGSRVSGTIQVSATASDNSGISSFKLYVDRKQVASTATGTINYNWNTKSVKAGSHTLMVTATDTSGNTSQYSITVYK